MLGDEELSKPERLLWDAIGSGVCVDRRALDAEFDDPANGAAWGVERTVRAQLLIELLTTERRAGGQRVRALRLRGAHISGTLNLEALTFVCPLTLEDCYFDAPVTLDEARAVSVGLRGCHLPYVSARQLETRGDLDLDRLRANKVDLAGAQIGGMLFLRHAELSSGHEHVLDGDRLQVRQEMDCSGLRAQGELRLLVAHIGGQLTLSGAELTNEGGRALTAYGVQVDADMFCRKRFTAHGEVC
jgi:hypothetical protein